MRPTRFAVVLFFVLLGCANLLYAQTSNVNSGPAVSAPERAQLTLLVRIKNKLTPEQQAKLAEIREKSGSK